MKESDEGNTSTSTIVIVDGNEYNIGTEVVSGQTTTATADQKQLTNYIAAAAEGSSVIIPVSQDMIVVSKLMLAIVEQMAKKNMTLTVQTGNVSYNIETAAIDLQTIKSSFGNADSEDVVFSVTISNSNIAISGTTVVANTVEFTITATYNDKSASINQFNRYINRTIEITADQAKQITTAVVVEPDGSLRHVPTYVYSKDGKWYAKINSMTNSTYALISNTVSFSDVQGKWYQDIVNEMASRKIITGVGENRYEGDRPITRAEFAATIIRALGLPENGTATFMDVPANAWYGGVVATAMQYGIVTGKGNNKFDPDANITREEAMVMVYRASRLMPYRSVTGVDNTGNFSDYGAQSAWATDGVKFNLNNGFIEGFNGKFNPKDTITRAENAAVILRLLQKANLIDIRSRAD
jgi:hypothetical protein